MVAGSKSKGGVKKKKVVKKKISSALKKKKSRAQSLKKAVVTRKSRKKVARKTAKPGAAGKKAASAARKKKPAKIPAKKKPIAKKTPVPEESVTVIRETLISITEAVPQTVTLPEPIAGQYIGKITHYYNHSNVAVVELEAGILRVGDTIRIKGHTTDFKQVVGSMQIEHQNIESAETGQTIGLEVTEMAREHDKVFKLE